MPGLGELYPFIEQIRSLTEGNGAFMTLNCTLKIDISSLRWFLFKTGNRKCLNPLL